MGRVLVGPVRFAGLCPDACEALVSAGHQLILNPSTAPFTRDDLLELAVDVDAAIVGMEDWESEIIAAASRLQILSKLGVGTDNIDLPQCRAFGIDVTNAPGANSNAVAELAVGLMLACSRHILAQDRTIRSGGWDRLTGIELTSKVVGLVGFGQAAQHVARRLAGFEPRLLAYDPYADPTRASALGAELLGLEELLRESDVISLHLPHTPETHHLLSDREFAAVKPGVIVINTSRGGVVDEEALHHALLNGQVGAAGIDVWETEPVPSDHPLLHVDNVVATCHGAADTSEAYAKVGAAVASAIIERLAGRRPANIRN